jgi:tetratricopeptide (TPR) repeat protein
VDRDGAGAAAERYHALRRSDPKGYDFSEDELNTLGYDYLMRGEIEEAIAVFKLNVEAYPKSANVYDSLGEAYMKGGERQLAVENYRRSLELNPDNSNGAAMLEKLKEGN